MGQNGWQAGGTASPETSLLLMALGIFGSPPLPPSPSVAAGGLAGTRSRGSFGFGSIRAKLVLLPSCGCPALQGLLCKLDFSLC